MRLGKAKQSGLVVVFLLCTASAAGQPGNSVKFQIGNNLQKTSVITENQSLIINYSISELNIEEVSADNGSFYRIYIADHNYTTVPGEPELPVYSRLISVPEGSHYSVKISNVISTRIKPEGKRIKGKLFPVQESGTKNEVQEKHPFIQNKKTYSQKGFLPADTVQIIHLGKARSKPLANLVISPVRYNPHSNVIEVITSMTIEISFTDELSSSQVSPLSRSSLFTSSLKNVLLNYNPDEVVPGYTDQPVKMIILTDSTFKKQLEPFSEMEAAERLPADSTL